MRYKNKYYSKKCEYDNIKFHSLKEMRRYCDLKFLEKVGRISDLQWQVKFNLIPSQKINNKLVERALNYIADFVYTEDGLVVVEDVKGFKTKDYTIKRKLMLYMYNISIKEV